MDIDLIRRFEARFREVLALLDDADADEDMEELNATFEDALFVIESISPGDADAEEAFRDALEEFGELRKAYAARGVPEATLARLDGCLALARVAAKF